MISMSGDGDLEFGRLLTAGLIGTNPPCGEVGLEWFGLDPELEIVTVAGDTLGVADLLTEGEALADLTPPESELAKLPGRIGRPGEIFCLSPGDTVFRRPGEILFLSGSPGDMFDLDRAGERLERERAGDKFDRCKPGDTTATGALSLAPCFH